MEFFGKTSAFVSPCSDSGGGNFHSLRGAVWGSVATKLLALKVISSKALLELLGSLIKPIMYFLNIKNEYPLVFSLNSA